MPLKTMSIRSANGQNQATFMPEKGGLCTSLIMADPVKKGEGRELLYLPQSIDLETYPKLGVAWPFCFPICGRLNRNGESVYLYHHQRYSLNIHGFSHGLPWEVLSHGADHITLQLKASRTTREHYPFEFEVQLAYQITDKQFLCTQTVVNHGKNAMPYYAGFHPYFWIDPARYQKADVVLNALPLKRLKYNENLTDIVGEKALFSLPIAITEPEVNESLLFLGHDRKVQLRFPDHSTLEMAVEGVTDPAMYPYLQLYHIPSEPFFCIEPWMGHPNAMNTANATRVLLPEASETAQLKLSLF